jgi:hypothetical protein
MTVAKGSRNTSVRRTTATLGRVTKGLLYPLTDLPPI